MSGAKAKSIRKAEAELRGAALEYARVRAEYHRLWRLHGETNKKHDADGKRIEEMHPETNAACSLTSAAGFALEAAASALLDAHTAAHANGQPVLP